MNAMRTGVSKTTGLLKLSSEIRCGSQSRGSVIAIVAIKKISFFFCRSESFMNIAKIAKLYIFFAVMLNKLFLTEVYA